MQRQLGSRKQLHRQRQLGDGSNVVRKIVIVNVQRFELVPDISGYIRTNLRALISDRCTYILVLIFSHRPLHANN